MNLSLVNIAIQIALAVAGGLFGWAITREAKPGTRTLAIVSWLLLPLGVYQLAGRWPMAWLTPLAIVVPLAWLGWWLKRGEARRAVTLAIGQQLAVLAILWLAVLGLVAASQGLQRWTGYRFDEPEYLFLLLLGQPLFVLGWRSMELLEGYRRWTSLALRLALLVVTVFILAGLQSVRMHGDLTVMALIDQSGSVRQFAQPPPSSAPGAPGGLAKPGEQLTIDEWVKRWVRSASSDHRIDDKLGVITFDGRPTVRALPSAGFDLDAPATEMPLDGTDVAAVIRLGLSRFGEDSSKRLLLAWDGNLTGNKADFIAALNEAAAAKVPVDVLPIEYALQHEVMVDGVYAPAEARKGQTVSIRVVLAGTAPARGKLTLTHNGRVINLTGKPDDKAAPIEEKDWTLQSERSKESDAETPAIGPWQCVRLIELPMNESGPSKFEATFDADPGFDQMVANNRAPAFSLIHGPGKILVVDGVGGDAGQILPKALAARNIDLEVVGENGLPATLADMQRYDAIILQNIPADYVPPPQQKALAKYVDDLGGGLIMVGGPESFAAGAWTNTEIDKILPVNCQIPSQTVMMSGAMVIVIDRSGSMMEGMTGSGSLSKEQLANEAACLALSTLYPQDYAGVLAFDTDVYTIWSLKRNENPEGLAKAVRSITPAGGTNIYPGLVEAYNWLAPLTPEDAALKHVILLTDGQSQDGDYFKIVGMMRKAGITLTTIGVGDDVDRGLLGRLAQMGGGKYYEITDAKNLPQVFIKEAKTIRKNLIKEVKFQPKLVATGSPIMAGINAVPQLRGFVLTGPKEDPRVYMPIVGPEGEPIFAHWQVGLGRTAAFTSDANNRWSNAWMDSDVYADFWSRMVRTIARPSASKAYDLTTSIRGDQMHLRLDASGASSETSEPGRPGPGSSSGTFQNFLTVEGTVITPEGDAVKVKLQQTGPGIYEADMPARRSGSYIVTLGAGGGTTSERGIIFGGASKPQSEELRAFSSNRENLELVAAVTHGRMLDPRAPSTTPLFAKNLVTESRSLRPLWFPLLILMMCLFLVDVASRRIAWDAAGIWRWTLDRLDAFAGIFQHREVKSETTLAALKTASAAVDKKLATPGAGAPGGVPPPVPGHLRPEPKAVPVATKKFDAAPDAEASEDFAAAIGAAKDEPIHRPRPAAGAAGDDATTSRLLDAKRRAREQMEGRQE